MKIIISERQLSVIKQSLNETYQLPLLFHGTKNSFDSFDLRFFNQGSGDGGWLGYGVYLTNDYEYAESYGDVLECEVHINNPYVLTDHMYSRSPDRLNNELGTYNSKLTTKKLIEMGYDSVILTYDNSEFDGPSDFIEICVFDPNKIKVVKSENNPLNESATIDSIKFIES